MKAVILAGGLGTRIAEETHLKPKPMIEIGDKPILWHIMKIYSSYGINEFIICLGYKGYLIKEYFQDYSLHMSDITIDMQNKKTIVHNNTAEPWKVTLVDTGINTMTGGRLRKVAYYLKDEDCFCMTYGDGVADVNISELIKFHKSHGKLATLTAVSPPEKFGILKFTEDNNNITNSIEAFKEKPIHNYNNVNNYINGGFFVLSPQVIEYIESDEMPWERKPLEKLAELKQLEAYKHNGFWQCMDTIRDREVLLNMYLSNKAPWVVW